VIRNHLVVHRGFTVSFFDALQPIRCHALAEPAGEAIAGGPFRHHAGFRINKLDQQLGEIK
jgi:hypothetical protein